jgi:hypothetical protein
MVTVLVENHHLILFNANLPGAIYDTGGTVTLNKCTILQNNGSLGGGIY